jgi:hypothetical protein
MKTYRIKGDTGYGMTNAYNRICFDWMKGQVYEYLLNYGWAMLIIIIVGAALFVLGVLNPETYQRTYQELEVHSCNALFNGAKPTLFKEVNFKIAQFQYPNNSSEIISIMKDKQVFCYPKPSFYGNWFYCGYFEQDIYYFSEYHCRWETKT